MEVRVQGKCGPVVKNVDEVLRQVQQKLQDQQKQWVAQLRDHPAKFADLEADIQYPFGQDTLREMVGSKPWKGDPFHGSLFRPRQTKSLAPASRILAAFHALDSRIL